MELIDVLVASHVNYKNVNLIDRMIESVLTQKNVGKIYIHQSGLSYNFKDPRVVIVRSKKMTQYEHYYALVNKFANGIITKRVLLMDDDDTLSPNYIAGLVSSNALRGYDRHNGVGQSYVEYEIRGCLVEFEWFKLALTDMKRDGWLSSHVCDCDFLDNYFLAKDEYGNWSDFTLIEHGPSVIYFARVISKRSVRPLKITFNNECIYNYTTNIPLEAFIDIQSETDYI